MPETLQTAFTETLALLLIYFPTSILIVTRPLLSNEVWYTDRMHCPSAESTSECLDWLAGKNRTRLFSDMSISNAYH